MADIWATNIVDGPVVYSVYTLAAVAIVALWAVRPSRRWARGAWWLTALLAAITGAGLGMAVMWFLVEVVQIYGLVDPTQITWLWVALGAAASAVCLASLWRSGWWRKILSVLALVLFVLTAAMTINIDFHQYPTLGSALGISAYGSHGLPAVTPAGADRPTVSTWTPPADMPEKGMIASVEIPGTTSHFAARPGVVYLPPAALVANPPDLPVVVVLSGQPGSPEDPFVAGHIGDAMDSYAATHRGLAPIIVSPDQLGSPANNPMCVDSPLGNSATYLTRDVPAWIRATLNVRADRADWGIGGFSQGGTCAIQLGAGYPQLFGNVIDISGEVEPTLGSTQETIDEGFGGDAAAYAAAKPLTILAANAPFRDTFAVFAVGENDAAFTPGQKKIYDAATAAGMTTEFFIVPGSGHDWHTGGYGLDRGLTELNKRWGLN